MLEGITVIDLTTLLPGPQATTQLQELGAAIWKIEPPEGDPARYAEPLQDGTGLVFQFHAREKSLARLNLKEPHDHKQLLQLVKQADVFIQSFRPGVPERLGIGYSALQAINPRLIYCALTGYGQSGPWALKAGHDINYLALSGMLSQHLESGGRPILPTLQWADLMGAQMAVEQILAALVERSRTGAGQFLDVGMAHAIRRLLRLHDAIYNATGTSRGIPEISGQVIAYHLYETRDHRWMALGALEQKFWQAFCRALKKPEWTGSGLSPAEPENPLYRDLESLFAAHSFNYWTQLSRQVDCCLTPVLTLAEAQNWTSHHYEGGASS